jgi:very-short-patch-repair endonuclease
MTDRRKKYNWDEIQKFYDIGNSLRDLSKEFGCSMSAMVMAVRKNKLKTRNTTDAANFAKVRKPRTHSEETKKKISDHRKKFIQENPDKVPYRMYHYSKHKPYTETYFIELFAKENIDLKYHLDVSIYELDFYNEDIKLCVEIDGNQHFYDQKIIESDLRRTKYLESLGWKVFRIRWSHYQRLTLEQKKETIQYIKNLIEGMRKTGLKLLTDEV